MADFLSRLVERSAGLAPVARPAAAPLFAPGPAMAEEPAPVGPEAVGVVPPGPAPVAAPTPKAPTPVLREDSAADSGRPGRGLAPAPPVLPPATLWATAPGTPRPAPAEVQGAPHRGAAREDRSPRPEESPGRGPLTTSGAEGPSDIPRRLPAWEGRRRADAEIRSVVPPLLRPREESAPRWAADLRPRGSPEAPPAPTVRISIGRIEVRAVAASAPAAPRPAPARKSTGLSLEEYLRPRGRGR
jgi:hypothetical protein